MKTQHTEDQREHRWTHFFHHLRIFIYVMALLVAIDLISGTDDIWVHWVAGIWGAILGMHLIETLFFRWRASSAAGQATIAALRPKRTD